MSTVMTWRVIVPVRGGSASKTRLIVAEPEARTELAQAFAADVVAAAIATPHVEGVHVVTRDPDTAAFFRKLGADIIDEPPGIGLDGAIRTASQFVRDRFPEVGIAALMGDIPALTSGALATALSSASLLELGVLSDHDGTGTTLLTATRGATLHPQYGAGSFQRHLEAGHAAITVPAGSTLQMDVDTLADLESVMKWPLGSHTRAALDALGEVRP